MVFQMYHSDWELSHDHIWTLRPFSRNRKKVIFDRMADIVLGCHTELCFEKKTSVKTRCIYGPGKNTLFQLTGCIYGLEKSHFCRQRGAFMAGEITILSPNGCIYGRDKLHFCLHMIGCIYGRENSHFFNL